MKTAAIDEPLTEAELNRLEQFLAALKQKDELAMGLEELDGFLTALIIGPESVMPSEYLQEIFGPEIMSNFTEEEANEILGLIFRHWNTIADTLEKGEFYDPAYRKFENDLPCANDWSHGFMRGADMHFESWAELVESDKHGAAVFAMMFFEHEHDPDPELRPPPLTSEKRKELIAYLEAGIVHAYNYFKPHRQREARKMAAARRSARQHKREPKIGRNDPCPCGSGKKYKRCCGAATVH